MSKRRHLIIMAVWVAVLAAAVIVFWDRLFPDGDVAANPVQTQTHAAPLQTRLVGRWRRLDGDYILEVKAVHDDGKVDAAYLNPRPIHVAKAQAITRGGFVTLVVTLQDRGYPGNMYTLTYDPQADRLEGVYYHRGIGQQFDVKFSRLGSAKNDQKETRR